MTDLDQPLFFVHVMKTAGTTLKTLIRRSFPTPAVYPNEIDDDGWIKSNMSIPYLTSLSDERMARTKIFSGHFPYIASELLGVPTTKLTLLRDPVDRVVSHLRQIRRNPDGFVRFAKSIRGVADPTLEQVYDDPYLRVRFFVDHQVRIFSLTHEDEPRSYVGQFEMHENRLEIAKEQLERVDVVGLTEDFASFRDELVARFGFSDEPVPRGKVAPGHDPEVSDALRERIHLDNTLDRAFYAHAKELVHRRSHDSR